MKRKVMMIQQQVQAVKKLRSTLPRRRRPEISPVLCSGEKNNKKSSIHLPEPSATSSHLTRGEVSCNSSRVSVNNRPEKKRRSSDESSGRRVVTRLYSKMRLKKDSAGGDDVEASEEWSCVDSSSNLVCRERNNEVSCAGTVEENDAVHITTSPAKITETANDTVSVTKAADSCLVSDAESSERNNAKSAHVVIPNDREISKQGSNDTVSKESSANNANDAVSNSELVCTEQLLLCDEVESDYSSAFSDILHGSCSEAGLSSDYTPSIWLESGSDFSVGGDDGCQSPTFCLFLEFSRQFCESSHPLEVKSQCSQFENECSPEYDRSLKFEDEEHELSYQMLRKRERGEVYMHDYAEEYCAITEYGDLVIQQRLHMVHWIVEQSTSKELQKETMFLGVSLLDRFLSKGFFKNKRNLQVAGIACLALATRLEENQPFNIVRKRTFYVGSDIYSRCEVVAMEWLVQEVLNFKCFMPTIYNFLWYYLKAARANEEVKKTAKYLAVLALLGHEQLCFWPSTVAAGLVILASLAAHQDACCSRVVETHLRTKEDDLPGCIKSLEWLVKYAC